MPALSPRWATTNAAATTGVPHPPRPAFSCPPTAPAWMPTTSPTLSPNSSTAPASVRLRVGVVLACTICDTRSRSPHCWAGNATAVTSNPSALAVHLARARRPEVNILVSAGRLRSCSRWPRTISSTRSGSDHEPARPDPAGILHRQAAPAAPSQPAHHHRLPRHLPAAADLRLARHRPPADPTPASSPWMRR